MKKIHYRSHFNQTIIIRNFRHRIVLKRHVVDGVENDGGVLFHSFWYGDKVEEMHGLLFTYYTEETLKQLIGDEYRILEMKQYTEMEDADSLCLVLQKK